jgi:hypothetical protein
MALLKEVFLTETAQTLPIELTKKEVMMLIQALGLAMNSGQMLPYEAKDLQRKLKNAATPKKTGRDAPPGYKPPGHTEGY